MGHFFPKSLVEKKEEESYRKVLGKRDKNCPCQEIECCYHESVRSHGGHVQENVVDNRGVPRHRDAAMVRVVAIVSPRMSSDFICNRGGERHPGNKRDTQSTRGTPWQQHESA